MLSRSDVEYHINLFIVHTRPFGPVFLKPQLNHYHHTILFVEFLHP